MPVEEVQSLCNELWNRGEKFFTKSCRLELIDTNEPGVRLLMRWVSAGVRESGDILGEVRKSDDLLGVVTEYGIV